MKRVLIILAALAALATAGTAVAATESHALPAGLPSGYLQINPTTCKFVHREIDVSVPGVGTSLSSVITALKANRAYDVAEDARHDIKLQCINSRDGKKGIGSPGPRGPRGFTGPAGPAGPAGGLSGYVRVSAPISFKQASASVTCPVGDVVLGGGATVEVGGAYPSSDTTWTVTRDNVWGHLKTGTVWATCAALAG